MFALIICVASIMHLAAVTGKPTAAPPITGNFNCGFICKECKNNVLLFNFLEPTPIQKEYFLYHYVQVKKVKIYEFMCKINSIRCRTFRAF